MEKRGQFYIMAAVIIVVIIASIASTVTYTILKPEPTTIKEFSADTNRETNFVLEKGLYNKEDVGALFDNFSQRDLAVYYLGKGDISQDSEIVIVYGDGKGNVNVVQYDKTNSGSVSTEGFKINVPENFINVTQIRVSAGTDYTDVTILNETYSFKLKDNQGFYFVMGQNRGGEKSFETNQPESDRDNNNNGNGNNNNNQR